jgi:uncharacterized protein YkwD
LRAIAAVVGAAIAALTAAPVQASAADASSPPSVTVPTARPSYYSTDVLIYVNAYRLLAGAPPVLLQWRLNNAAIGHAKDMANRRHMSHIGSDGSNAGTRITRAGFNWWIWGENVAAGQRTSARVVTAWYNSPAHRAIMLDRRYRYMGLGRSVASDGTPYWALVFASPS